ncbi:MAG: hypothetical protein ABIR33_07310 [Pyrinomonadaceae bacterium]
MRDPTVLSALDAAWRDTNADVIPIVAAVEQGGWIYMDLRSGRISIARKDNRLQAPRGQGGNQAGYADIDLNNPPTVAGSIVVANFHTHPMTPFGGASDPDIQLANGYGVPGIVRGQNNAYDMTGTMRRIGPFTNPTPGYPPRNAFG